eukprot:gene1999-1506_t
MNQTENEQLLILIIDRSLKEDQIEFSQKFIQNVVESLKQLFVTFCCVSSKVSLSKICILESNETSIEIVYPLDNFNLLAIFQMLNKFGSKYHSKPSYDKNMIKINLETSLGIIKESKIEKNIHLVYITAIDLNLSNTDISIIQSFYSQNYSLNFIQIRKPLQLSNISSNFSEIISNFPNCTESTVSNDSILLKRSLLNCSNHFLNFLQSDNLNFIISLSNENLNQDIHCKSNIEIIENLNISYEKICKCHGHPINQMNEVDICGMNHRQLDDYQIEKATKIGNCILPIKFEMNSNSTKTIKLKVIDKIKLESISESQLSGKTFILIPSFSTNFEEMIENDRNFYSLSNEMESSKIGLILESSFDFENKSEMKKFYLLMGEINGNSMIFQHVITQDEILTNLKREIENEKSTKIINILDSMKLNNFNPMNYNSG